MAGAQRPMELTEGGSTSLFYRDLGARWLTTRSKYDSKMGIRRSNKNRLTLSKTP